MRFSALLLLLLASFGAIGKPLIDVPKGFVLQSLDTTDGQIARPKDWFYANRGTPGGWIWTISKEDPAKGPYQTGMLIELVIGVEKRTGQSRETFVQAFIADKRASTQVVKDCQKADIGEFYRQCIEVIEVINRGGKQVPFHILYSVMWGKKMDMAVVSIFGAPPDAWESVAPIANKMASFMLIGPNFGK